MADLSCELNSRFAKLQTATESFYFAVERGTGSLHLLIYCETAYKDEELSSHHDVSPADLLAVLRKLAAALESTGFLKKCAFVSTSNRLYDTVEFLEPETGYRVRPLF